MIAALFFATPHNIRSGSNHSEDVPIKILFSPTENGIKRIHQNGDLFNARSLRNPIDRLSRPQ
jgi:hypothetical protein